MLAKHGEKLLRKGKCTNWWKESQNVRTSVVEGVCYGRPAASLTAKNIKN